MPMQRRAIAPQAALILADLYQNPNDLVGLDGSKTKKRGDGGLLGAHFADHCDFQQRRDRSLPLIRVARVDGRQRVGGDELEVRPEAQLEVQLELEVRNVSRGDFQQRGDRSLALIRVARVDRRQRSGGGSLGARIVARGDFQQRGDCRLALIRVARVDRRQRVGGDPWASRSLLAAIFSSAATAALR